MRGVPSSFAPRVQRLSPRATSLSIALKGVTPSPVQLPQSALARSSCHSQPRREAYPLPRALRGDAPARPQQQLVPSIIQLRQGASPPVLACVTHSRRHKCVTCAPRVRHRAPAPCAVCCASLRCVPVRHRTWEGWVARPQASAPAWLWVSRRCAMVRSSTCSTNKQFEASNRKIATLERCLQFRHT